MTDTNETPKDMTDNAETRETIPTPDGQGDSDTTAAETTADTVELSPSADQTEVLGTETPSIAGVAVTPTPQPSAPVTVGTGRPPIRWGGVVWGVLMIAFAGTVLFAVSSPDRLSDATVLLEALTSWNAGVLWLAAIGAIIAVSAILGGIGATQRRRRRTPA